MTPKQANTLRGMKAKENKAYAAAVIERGYPTSADMVAALGEGDALVTAWRTAAETVETFYATIRR